LAVTYVCPGCRTLRSRPMASAAMSGRLTANNSPAGVFPGLRMPTGNDESFFLLFNPIAKTIVVSCRRYCVEFSSSAWRSPRRRVWGREEAPAAQPRAEQAVPAAQPQAARAAEPEVAEAAQGLIAPSTRATAQLAFQVRSGTPRRASANRDTAAFCLIPNSPRPTAIRRRSTCSTGSRTPTHRGRSINAAKDSDLPFLLHEGDGRSHAAMHGAFQASKARRRNWAIRGKTMCRTHGAFAGPPPGNQNTLRSWVEIERDVRAPP